jgi:hypothetical protein
MKILDSDTCHTAAQAHGTPGGMKQRSRFLRVVVQDRAVLLPVRLADDFDLAALPEALS